MSNKYLFSCLVAALIVSMTACGGNQKVSWSFPSNEGSAARGEELFYGLASCNACHASTEWFSQFQDWTVTQLRFAIKKGKGRDGDSTEQHDGFQWMSESDSFALISFIASKSGGLLQKDSLFEDSDVKDETGYVPAINPRYAKQYGKYLIDHVARCSSCHTMGEGLFSDEVYLGGGEEVEMGGEEFTAPALIGDSKFVTWSPSQMLAFFQFGVKPDGSTINGKACPVGSFGKAKAEDLSSMMEYLQSLANG